MMRIITTPMCEDILKLAGLTGYYVVKADEIENADLAIVLSETKTTLPKLSLKLNTYTQVYDSITEIHERFDTEINMKEVEVLKKLIEENSDKRSGRKDIKVKVYSNFLKETVEDMGFDVTSNCFDYVVYPDYLKDSVSEIENLVAVPSHKNVSTSIIERITERYTLLERELCMKQ